MASRKPRNKIIAPRSFFVFYIICNSYIYVVTATVSSCQAPYTTRSQWRLMSSHAVFIFRLVLRSGVSACSGLLLRRWEINSAVTFSLPLLVRLISPHYLFIFIIISVSLIIFLNRGYFLFSHLADWEDDSGRSLIALNLPDNRLWGLQITQQRAEGRSLMGALEGRFSFPFFSIPYISF